MHKQQKKLIGLFLFESQMYLTEGTDGIDLFYQKMLVIALSPYVVLLLAVLFWCAYKLINRRPIAGKIKFTIVILFFQIQPSQLNSIFSTLSCVNFDGIKQARYLGVGSRNTQKQPSLSSQHQQFGRPQSCWLFSFAIGNICMKETSDFTSCFFTTNTIPLHISDRQEVCHHDQKIHDRSSRQSAMTIFDLRAYCFQSSCFAHILFDLQNQILPRQRSQHTGRAIYFRFAFNHVHRAILEDTKAIAVDSKYENDLEAKNEFIPKRKRLQLADLRETPHYFLGMLWSWSCASKREEYVKQ
eukprot:TRINITY_DN1868_c0_g1_i10.p1 TRINITY_DN1868_c0_g1~~TRINITY_DN1868_c0_g1_i10.p1  ORF type:complete len:299 (-),score=-24.32 TRINITY_DN1868_c0_g1_i10:358-1254(-)